jgi:phage shock protein A
MAEKQSILGRIAQLTRANINAIIDRAEDPQKMLDQLVRDFTSSIAEAEDAVAVTIGNLRLAEQDHAADVADARDWGQKALAAAQKAEQVRAQGNQAEAARFDNLAKVAIGKQIAAENEAKTAEPMIASQNEVVEKLKVGLQDMRVKLDELKSKRDQLVARAKSAQAQKTVQGAIASINVMDPTSEIARFEEQVRREEAYVAGQAELQGSSLEDQFAELEDYGRNAEIEARLAALKGGTGALEGGTAAPQQIGATAAAAGATGADEGSAAVNDPAEDKTTY